MKQFYHFQDQDSAHVFVAADDVIAIKESYDLDYNPTTQIVTRKHSYHLVDPVGFVIQNIINGKNDAVIRIDLEPVKTKSKNDA